MRDYLRAGIALYNAGEYHTAHDAWEDHWLALDSGTDDERLLHGLIQFTAAVFHARNTNWSGATGLAESAGEYLAALPGDYRGVNVGTVRRALAALAADPEMVERREPPALAHESQVIHPADLRLGATCVAAEALAEANGYDEALFEDAVAYARADLEHEETASPFVPLLFDFVREPASRGVVTQRLREHVDRRASKDDDVTGLFEPNQ